MSEFTGEVHPLADALPMLPSDELADLAQDIKENGLIDPLTLDKEGRLIDGRNRLAACEMAGVTPTFVVYDGDPEALVLSRGGRRRNISAGQRAMLTARVMWNRGLWDGERWKYGAKSSIVADAKIQTADLAMCGAVLSHSTDLAADVLAGTTALRAAYDQAQDAKKAKAETDRQLAVLADEAPDLYRRTQDGDPIEETWAAYLVRTKEQREREQENLRRIRQELERLAYGAEQARAFADHAHLVERMADEYDPDLTPHGKPITRSDLLAAAEGLAALAERWPVA